MGAASFNYLMYYANQKVAYKITIDELKRINNGQTAKERPRKENTRNIP